MRVTIRDKSSSWKKSYQWSSTGIGVGSSYVHPDINYMGEGVDSYMSIFADDAKLLRGVDAEGECGVTDFTIS